MQTFLNADLSRHHTFSMPQSSSYLVEVSSVEELIEVYQHPDFQALPKLMLGRGSNVLFTDTFDGVVIVNRILGKKVTESEHHWHLRVEAGEDWPSLVAWCVEQGYAGLENLALIPGCVGSAPIQNIGAYGVELKDVCEYVDVLCLDTFKVIHMTASECNFGYRDSIFKRDLHQKVVVVAVGLKLNREWQPNLGYGPLQSFDINTVTAQQIFQRVCQSRKEKLPNPEQTGNAGCFFKNPVISHELHEKLKAKFPNLVSYSANNGMKIAAGWLIDQCDLKGAMVGGAQVHLNHALFIVNTGSASSSDVVQLAAKVWKKVKSVYGIELEHEVQLIGRKGETNLKNMLEEKS